MNILNFFSRRNSAPVARERLQILLAHERGMVGGESDLVSLLREEIVALVRRHVNVERDNIQVKMNRGGDVSTLEIEVEIPSAIPGSCCRTRLKSDEADRVSVAVGFIFQIAPLVEFGIGASPLRVTPSSPSTICPTCPMTRVLASKHSHGL